MKIRNVFRLVAVGVASLFAGSAPAVTTPNVSQTLASVVSHDDRLAQRLLQRADPNYVSSIGDMGGHSQHFL